jgi:hypothetical protein
MEEKDSNAIKDLGAFDIYIHVLIFTIGEFGPNYIILWHLSVRKRAYVRCMS